jgi:hypothetical protein
MLNPTVAVRYAFSAAPTAAVATVDEVRRIIPLTLIGDVWVRRFPAFVSAAPKDHCEMSVD